MAWYSKFYDETGLIEVGGVQLPARSWFGDTPDAELKQYADRQCGTAGGFRRIGQPF